MTVYTGERRMEGTVVLVDGQPLDPRYDLKTISDNGFEWTYEGPEPAQLALAILAHHLKDDRKALQLHEAFMREVVANLDNEWEMTGADIDGIVAELAGAAPRQH